MRSRSVVGNHSESKPFSQIPEDETSSPTPNYSSGPVCPGSGRAPGSAWGAWLCLIGVPQEVAAGPPAALEDDKLQSPGAHGAAGVPPGDAGACSWPPRGSPVRVLVSSTAGGGHPAGSPHCQPHAGPLAWRGTAQSRGRDGRQLVPQPRPTAPSLDVTPAHVSGVKGVTQLSPRTVVGKA